MQERRSGSKGVMYLQAVIYMQPGSAWTFSVFYFCPLFDIKQLTVAQSFYIFMITRRYLVIPLHSLKNSNTEF